MNIIGIIVKWVVILMFIFAGLGAIDSIGEVRSIKTKKNAYYEMIVALILASLIFTFWK